MRLGRKKEGAAPSAVRYPGISTALDGTAAVVEMETAASEAAGAYPTAPAAGMAEGWSAAVAQARTNAHGRRLLFFQPEGEAAAAAVTAGMAMVGLRAASFVSGSGVAAMHESLYAAVGKRLTYVLNVACGAVVKHARSAHASHDDYHAVDDTGFFQLFARSVQAVADLNLIAHRLAELSLNPGICAQDGFLTSHAIESVRLPERALVKEFLGDPADTIESPTPAQRLVFGERRRRIPEMFDLDYPMATGVVQNQDSYQQGVAAQRPFYFDHVPDLADRAFEEYAALSGRRYARATGYRIEDAEYVIVGQGSVVGTAEAVSDHLRESRRLRVGVLDVTMFRPFPADLITAMLAGKKGVVVLERVDQPLAVDPPLLREIRAAMSKAVENWRARGAAALPHAGVAACAPDAVPDFYSGCYGLGGREVQPGDLVAAVGNMGAAGARRRQFYLGIDFVRAGTRLPKLQIWQERLLEHYPGLGALALPPVAGTVPRPEGALAIRVHSMSGAGGATLGRTLARVAAGLLGLSVKATPRPGAERKGLPTTLTVSLARATARLADVPTEVDVVLSPDPNAIRRGDPLAGLVDGGVFVIQSEHTGPALWERLPVAARRAIKRRRVKVWSLDGFAMAAEEVADAALRTRAQAAAFLGAFFRVAPLPGGPGPDEATLFPAIGAALDRELGPRADGVVEDALRVIRRGFADVRELDVATCEVPDTEVGTVPVRPAALDGAEVRPGLAHPGRFWEQVGFPSRVGLDGIADPYAAVGALPALTSTIRDMTETRQEVPEFVADRCTGCGRCWTQCPDMAIPGVVNAVDDVVHAAVRAASQGRSLDRVRQIVRHVAGEARRIMKEEPFTTFGDVAGRAYAAVAGKLGYEPERQAVLDAEWAPVAAALAEFPLAKTAAFFDLAESRSKGQGGLLSVTVDPEACKGCGLCVEVCPEDALRSVRQTDEVVGRLRRNRQLWSELPDTDDRYVQLASEDPAIGPLAALLLKKDSYLSMRGGDPACPGCGEKTALHLVLAAVNAQMRPQVAAHVARLDDLIARLDQKARTLLASDADLANVGGGRAGTVGIVIDPAKATHVELISAILRDLKDLRWRYTEGPGGRGRSVLGMANATGCSAVWASTHPFNPYPFPWVSHLYQDAPSVAVGIFEGHMRKMAAGFAAVRRAELELGEEYDPAVHEAELGALDWRGFTDEELALCPPILAVGGDGAMLDAGWQSLSRLLVSGRPIRVVVLDTQGSSSTGGQVGTSGFPGQVGDMAEAGPARRGKQETRKELALLAMAHRSVFVLQSSPATPGHLAAGVLRGLRSRHPAVFVLHCPCPTEHGIADSAAAQAATLALESRAFPVLVYDPDAGPRLADRLSLDGNPSADAPWPVRSVRYLDEGGAEQTVELPVTVADWAATEARFRPHFTPVPPETPAEGPVPFSEYLALPGDDRAERTPFIQTLDAGRRLGRLAVSPEIVRLAEERRELWTLLRDMAGLKQPEGIALEAEFERRMAALRAEYEAKLADLRARYPRVIARRLAETILGGDNSKGATGELLARVQAMPGTPRPSLDGGGTGTAVAPPPAAVATAAPVAAPAAAPAAPEKEAPLSMEPYIDTALCTACNECTNLNKRMFAYDGKKQAYIKDARAGTFKQIVQAAEKCPVKIIHPGTPLDPNEKDLDKWIARAKPFN